MPSRLNDFLSASEIRGDEDDPLIHRRLGIELKVDGFDVHYSGLRGNPEATLLADIESLRALALRPDVRQERAEFAQAFRKYLGEEVKTSEATLVDERAEPASVELFISAKNPVLIIGGRGPAWESKNPTYASMHVDAKKIQLGAIQAMERYLEEPKTPIFLALFSASNISMDRRLCDIFEHHANPDAVGEDAKELVDRFILPRLKISLQEGEVDETLLKKQARFTMQRTCFGDVVGKQMDVYLPIAMREAGFEEEHIKTVQEQILVFSVLGIGGKSEAPVKTIAVGHPFDTYPARYGHDTSTHEYQRYIRSNAPSTEIGFHHPKLGFGAEGIAYSRLLQQAIRDGVASEHLPDLKTLYNPSRHHSETHENPMISALVMSGELKKIRQFVKGIEQGSNNR